MRASGWLLITMILATGCARGPDHMLSHRMQGAEFGQARARLQDNLTTRRGDRNYLLDQMRLGIATLADGYVDAAELVFQEAYDLLRTQGINQDRTVAAVALHDGVRIWKGEPFEQAMAFHYVATLYAAQGSWDNARAASQNALFQLKDFGVTDMETLATRAAEAERRGEGDILSTGYVPRESNFALAHLMSAVANQQMGRQAEAADFFRTVVRLDRRLEPLVQTLQQGRYNTILVVDYGLGPMKYGTGPDNAVAAFRPRTYSSNAPLQVDVDGRTASWPHVTDLNTMARDHKWNNLEDARIAKSHLGTALMVGGMGAAAYGAHANNEAAMWAGLGAIAAGALTRATASADTRYCEAMPQRVYLVPLNVDRAGTSVRLQVGDDRSSELRLLGLTPPPGGGAQLRYVRLVSGRGGPPRWATSGRIHYGSDVIPAEPAGNYPWILGGVDIRRPTEQVMAEYLRAGHLRGWTLQQVVDLYRAEGILVDDHPGRMPGMHILEGGNSLVSPQGGTVGFTRLVGMWRGEHPARSDALRRARQAMPPPPTVTQAPTLRQTPTR